MENPRAEKVAVVEEVRERFAGAAASVVTEYRGLTVAELAELRRALSAAGGDYKVYKNTLVRLAIAGGDHAGLEPLLTGPTAIAFVREDVSAVAKALREFSRTSPNLVVKGGLLDGEALSISQLNALADLPSRDVLLARLAGALAAPLTQLAGLLQAMPRNFAYGLSALVERQGGADEGAPGAGDAAAGAEPASEVVETAEAPPAAEAATDAAEVAEAPPAAEAAEEGAAPEAAQGEEPADEAPETAGDADA